MRLLKYMGKIPQFNFETDIDLFPIGDMHIGHPATDYHALNDYIRYIERKDNTYVAMMGDEVEGEIPSRSGSWGYEQDYMIDKQLDKLYEIFKPLGEKRKILTKVNSTHTGWTRKLTGHDIDKEIAEKLNAIYMGVGGYWKLNAKERRYTIFQQHGSSSSKYPEYELTKAMESFPTANVYLMAHVHQIAARPYTKKVCYGDIEYDMIQWAIRTGGFVGNKEWARERLLPQPSLGAPRIMFNSSKFDIDVNLNGISSLFKF